MSLRKGFCPRSIRWFGAITLFALLTGCSKEATPEPAATETKPGAKASGKTGNDDLGPPQEPVLNQIASLFNPTFGQESKQTFQVVGEEIRPIGNPNDGGDFKKVEPNGPDFGPDDKVEEIEFNGDPLLSIVIKEQNQRFGIGLPRERDPRNPGETKRLTYAPDGSYNNTCVKIDGYENIFGQNPGGWDTDRQGQIKQREILPGRAWVSTWKFPQNVFVTQTLFIIPNDATKKLDTLLVHYLIENRDSRSHSVGTRVMLDTFIGANDGTPFLVPGRPGLVDTKLDIINSRDIPDFVQTLESPDLAKPGVIAQVNLKLPAGLRLNAGDPEMEPITRLVISRYPGNPEIRWDFVRDGKFWDMNDKSKGRENDSCVTVYGEYRPMVPKEKRVMAFTYGLGQLSSLGKNDAKLGLTYGGQPQPGKQITVSAWLRDARPNQRVMLDLPAGMKFVEGYKNEQLAVAGVGRLSQASWKVEVDEAAKPAIYSLKAASEREEQSVDVRVRNDFKGTLNMK
ncbi:MAG: hypothetical protein AB7K24_13565 [Gemmataceae bacterium]